MTLRKLLLTVTMAAALTGPATDLALAADAPPPAPTAAPAKPAAPRRRAPVKPPPKVEELEALVIEGKIQKPEVFYVLGRAESHYRGLEVRRSFVPQIVESLKRNPL